jgi:hypothetical protein
MGIGARQNGLHAAVPARNPARRSYLHSSNPDGLKRPFSVSSLRRDDGATRPTSLELTPVTPASVLDAAGLPIAAPAPCFMRVRACHGWHSRCSAVTNDCIGLTCAVRRGACGDQPILATLAPRPARGVHCRRERISALVALHARRPLVRCLDVGHRLPDLIPTHPCPSQKVHSAWPQRLWTLRRDAPSRIPRPPRWELR